MPGFGSPLPGVWVAPSGVPVPEEAAGAIRLEVSAEDDSGRRLLSESWPLDRTADAYLKFMKDLRAAARLDRRARTPVGRRRLHRAHPADPPLPPRGAARSAAAAGAAARIDADERIEPNDWMPEAYRKTLVRQISQHAHSEIVGMLPEGNWITRAPSLRRKAACSPRCRTRRPRALSLCRRRDARRLARGAGRAELLAGKAKYSSIFNYPTLTWADIGAIGWLVDGAAIMNQCRCAAAPTAPMRAR
jgi:hypothetical protein